MPRQGRARGPGTQPILGKHMGLQVTHFWGIADHNQILVDVSVLDNLLIPNYTILLFGKYISL